MIAICKSIQVFTYFASQFDNTKNWQHICFILSPPTPGTTSVHRLVSLPFRRTRTLRRRHQRPLIYLVRIPLRLPLSGQGPVTTMAYWSGNRTSCWGDKRWDRSSTLIVALTPSLAACFLWCLVSNPGLPLCWHLG